MVAAPISKPRKSEVNTSFKTNARVMASSGGIMENQSGIGFTSVCWLHEPAVTVTVSLLRKDKLTLPFPFWRTTLTVVSAVVTVAKLGAVPIVVLSTVIVNVPGISLTRIHGASMVMG